MSPIRKFFNMLPMLIGCAVMLFSLIIALNQYRLSHSGKMVEATVNTSRYYGKINGEHLYDVRYHYTVGGKVYHNTINQVDSSTSIRAGDSIVIRYNPNKPNNSQIVNNPSQWTYWLWVLLFGAVLFKLGLNRLRAPTEKSD